MTRSSTLYTNIYIRPRDNDTTLQAITQKLQNSSRRKNRGGEGVPLFEETSVTFRGEEYQYRSMLGTRNESTVNVEFIVQGFVIRCAYTCQKPTFRARLVGMLSPSIGRIDSSPYETCASIYRFLNYKMHDARRIRYAANRNRTRINLCMLRSRYVKASSFFRNVAHRSNSPCSPPTLLAPVSKLSSPRGWKPFIALIFSLRLRNSKHAFTFHLDDISHKSFSICASVVGAAFDSPFIMILDDETFDNRTNGYILR